MYKIFYYRKENGKSPVKDYIDGLEHRKDKSSCIAADKIYEYINLLKEKGKGAGEPYVKHLDGEIWELRPLKDRILFAAWDGKRLIMLHHFVKKTQKTPRKEIERAKRYLADIRERKGKRA